MFTCNISVDDSLMEQIRPMFPNNEELELWVKSQLNILIVDLVKTISHESKPQASLSQRLRGIAKAPKDFDYKQELENRFNE